MILDQLSYSGVEFYGEMFSPLLSALCVLGLPSIVRAENHTLRSLAVNPCTFKLEVKPADDFSYIDLIYSTKGATPNSLLSYGLTQSNNQRRCYSLTIISHPNRSARARPLKMELSGSVKLDAGLTAKVETSLVWGAMAAMVRFACSALPYLGVGIVSHAPP